MQLTKKLNYFRTQLLLSEKGDSDSFRLGKMFSYPYALLPYKFKRKEVKHKKSALS